VVLGCAALLVLALLWKYGPAKQPHSQEFVAKDASAPAATLDYRNWTAERIRYDSEVNVFRHPPDQTVRAA
jgi:hypothetical protein